MAGFEIGEMKGDKQLRAEHRASVERELRRIADALERAYPKPDPNRKSYYENNRLEII